MGGGIGVNVVDDPTGHRLTMANRCEIYAGLSERASFTDIAARIGFSVATVSREVGGRGGRASYRPVTAHRHARRVARRPKATKLSSHPVLCARVIADLESLLPPTDRRTIAHRVRER